MSCRNKKTSVVLQLSMKQLHCSVFTLSQYVCAMNKRLCQKWHLNLVYVKFLTKFQDSPVDWLPKNLPRTVQLNQAPFVCLYLYNRRPLSKLELKLVRRDICWLWTLFRPRVANPILGKHHFYCQQRFSKASYVTIVVTYVTTVILYGAAGEPPERFSTKMTKDY